MEYHCDKCNDLGGKYYRDENGYRNYNEEDIHKIERIMFLRDINVPIEDIKDILNNKVTFQDVLENHIEKVNTKNNEKNISVTISLGVYSYHLNDKPANVIMNADKALYQAKEHGRNQVVVFSESN